VLTVLDDERTAYRALSLGASGYLVKPDGVPSIAGAVDHLIAGGSPISPRIARWLLDDLRARDGLPCPPEDVDALTPREVEVVELFAAGATYAEVGRALGITVNTVRQYVRQLYDKLHVCSKTEAVLKVMPHAGRL
jgi:DNA-binding NarL/FixJ family response regulator